MGIILCYIVNTVAVPMSALYYDHLILIALTDGMGVLTSFRWKNIEIFS